MSTIMIIDDDHLYRDVLKQTLERQKYSVVSVEDGYDGVKQLENNPVDLIITDIIMPKMEGLETISTIKKKYPTIPIIAISGGGRLTPANSLRAAQKLGADVTFTKPVNRRKLVEAIESLICI